MEFSNSNIETDEISQQKDLCLNLQSRQKEYQNSLSHLEQDLFEKINEISENMTEDASNALKELLNKEVIQPDLISSMFHNIESNSKVCEISLIIQQYHSRYQEIKDEQKKNNEQLDDLMNQLQKSKIIDFTSTSFFTPSSMLQETKQKTDEKDPMNLQKIQQIINEEIQITQDPIQQSVEQKEHVKNQIIDTISTENILIQNKQDIQNQFTQIKSKGIDQISNLIKEKLKTENKSSLDLFINYLLLNIEKLDKNDPQFEEIIDKLDLSSKQLKEILNVWEHISFQLKEKSNQINQIEQELSQLSKNNLQQTPQIEIIYSSDQLANNNQILALNSEIQELQTSISQIIQGFETFLIYYLKDKHKTVEISQVQKLVLKLNIEIPFDNEQNELILEDFDLSRKQENEVKTELEKCYNQIKQKNEEIQIMSQKIVSLQQFQVNNSEKQDKQDSVQALTNGVVKAINEISQCDWSSTHKETLEKLISFIITSIGLGQEISKQQILDLIEDVELSRAKEKQVLSVLNQFIDDIKYDLSKKEPKTNQLEKQQTEEDLFYKFLQDNINKLSDKQKQIFEKQQKIINDLLKEYGVDEKQSIQCKTFLSSHIGENESFQPLQQFLKNEGWQKEKIYDLFKKWFKVSTDMPEKKKQFILELQSMYLEKHTDLVEETIVVKLIGALQDQNENDIDEIFDSLEISNKQTKQLLKIWQQFQEEMNEDMYSPELLEFKQFIINQIKDPNLQTKFNNNKAQIVQNLLNSTDEGDSNELSDIYDEFRLTLKQTKLIQQEFQRIYKKEKSIKPKEIQQIKVNEEEKLNTQINKDHKKYIPLSQPYTVVYQQEDHCLDLVSVKVICDFKQIQELMKQVKTADVKTIGFYGDYLIAMKIIMHYYPKATQVSIPPRYQPPEFDKLIAYTDGSVIFLILQENRNTFEGDIFENEEGQLYIRFLLDSCSIIVTCLNQKQVSSWSDINPFEQFDAIVPPREIKDRSTIVFKNAIIKSNVQKDDYIYFLSNDQNNCIFRSKLQDSSMIDQNQDHINIKNIDLNKSNVNRYFQSNLIYEYIDYYKLYTHQKNVEDIFILHNESYNSIKQTFMDLKSTITDLQKKYVEEEIKLYQANFILKHESSSTPSPIFIQNSLLSEEEFICKECQQKTLEANNQKNMITYYCKKCFSITQIIDLVTKKIENSRYSFKWAKQIYYYNVINMNLYDLASKYQEQQSKNSEINFKEFQGYLSNQIFSCDMKTLSDNILSEILTAYEHLTFLKKQEEVIVTKILDFIMLQTFKVIEKKSGLKNKINNDIRNEGQLFLKKIESIYFEFKQIKEKRLFISPLQITYDPAKKNEIFISINSKLGEIILNNQIHKIVDYIQFDDQVDYLVCNNCYEKDISKQYTQIYILRKKRSTNPIQLIYSFSGIDSSIFINQYSKQWAIFINDKKKHSIGKINNDYSFEEGKIDVNIYFQQTQQKNIIQNVNSCIILNEKTNVIYLYEEKKNQFYELFLNGHLKEVKFNITKEESIDGVTQLIAVTEEQIGKIKQIKNSPEADLIIFQTEKYLIFTNPNYIIKNQIELKDHFQQFKFISTDTALLLVVLYNNNYECYILQGSEDNEHFASMSVISEDKKKIGNIVIDKVIKSMQHYGGNFSQIGCPELVYQLFYYENSSERQIQNFEKVIDKYLQDCITCKNISFQLNHNQKNIFNGFDSLIQKIDSLLNIVNPISVQEIQFILQTRIPIQLTTIQQSNYLPLKDGLFKQDIMNIPAVENQIELIKRQISLGWIENAIEKEEKNIYVAAMCGRQSVGKSSQLNRMFGTRFGVSASRCTDGIWIGLSKIEDKLILIMDCEGLFSIRRNEDEEVKLLQQITLVSDITIIFCDIDGISQPLLSLFKKLQLCSGKKQGENYFLGTMVLLTKNVQDEGDKKKLLSESETHLSKKEVKITIQNIFRKGVSYGFLKNYLARDYDSNLQRVRDDLLYKNILLKNNPKQPLFLMNLLKYSMIQIYLDDDQDIELISKQAEIKDEFEKFTELFFDISQQKFIKNEKLIVKFQYNAISEEEVQIIDPESIFEYQTYELSNIDMKDDNINTNDIELNQNMMNIAFIDQTEENKENNDDVPQNLKAQQILKIDQSKIKLVPQQQQFIAQVKKSFNREQLESIFSSCFRQLQRANFNNYIDQMQQFFDSIIQSRQNIIREYYMNRMPKEPKFADIVHTFEQKLQTILHSLDNQIQICKKKCFKCNRNCINSIGHKGNCSCESSHKCYSKCEICKSSNECFLISGHEGTHFCREMNHLCQQPCQSSLSCKDACTLQPHTDDIKHSCQRLHKCEHQCRLYDKCGRSCSLENGHEEQNHICDSTQCFDKCELCNELCGYNVHDHDILLRNVEKNQHLLIKDGKLITNHLCGNSHPCKQKCEKPGVCSIVYHTENKVWETKAASKFEYLFFKPERSLKECTHTIEPWDINHNGNHSCSNTTSHRCDQQCPECLSYCHHDFNHSGNHHSKNHRNKEKCIFVSETDNVQVKIDKGNIRQYKAGESATPETCLQSCNRMGRAHIHLRVCKGGSECAEKKYPFARHSTKIYKPHTHLVYDEMLCKGYWNSINWEPPADEETLQEIQSCNVGCSHESHSEVPNYCKLPAWHHDSHQIDPKKCEHLGSGIIDICFTIDTTGSMGWAMSTVSDTVNKIMESFEGKADIQYAIVSYRDHPPQDSSYVYKIDSHLTNKDSVLKVLSGMSASGGGDGPEAVMDGLYYTTTEIRWREKSQRFIFHICDSPPHGQKFGSSSSDSSWTQHGCPCKLNESTIASQLNSKKIFYYLVKASDSLNMMESIFQSTFGAQYKQSLQYRDPGTLKVDIVSVLKKEINITTEFYHVN